MTKAALIAPTKTRHETIGSDRGKALGPERKNSAPEKNFAQTMSRVDKANQPSGSREKTESLPSGEKSKFLEQNPADAGLTGKEVRHKTALKRQFPSDLLVKGSGIQTSKKAKIQVAAANASGPQTAGVPAESSDSIRSPRTGETDTDSPVQELMTDEESLPAASGEDAAENAVPAVAAAVSASTPPVQDKKSSRTTDHSVAGKQELPTEAVETSEGKDSLSGNRKAENTFAPRVEVEDNRTPEDAQESSFSDKMSERRTVSARAEAGNAARGSDSVREQASPPSGEANPVIAETDIELSPRGSSASGRSGAAAELTRRLDAQEGNEIVRQVKVVLNRSDAGEVRINLRPDNLGRVRVRIRLEENRLTGRIFVESAAAREAFRNALDGLQTKLVESGFGAADLELAWDDGASSFAREDGNRSSQGDDAERRRAAADEFEQTVPVFSADGNTGESRVNLVV